ncbi:MAG: hypothetical protein ACRDBG_08295 [Waterburya sp.]
MQDEIFNDRVEDLEDRFEEMSRQITKLDRSPSKLTWVKVGIGAIAALTLLSTGWSFKDGQLSIAYQPNGMHQLLLSGLSLYGAISGVKSNQNS